MRRDLHHETMARLTRADGLPVDYVNNGQRKQPFNQDGNCMSQNYRRHAVGVAPSLWKVDPTPSMVVTRNGRSHTLTVKEFRTGQRATKVEAKVDHTNSFRLRMLARAGNNHEMLAAD